jgi:hypothetical protein
LGCIYNPDGARRNAAARASHVEGAKEARRGLRAPLVGAGGRERARRRAVVAVGTRAALAERRFACRTEGGTMAMANEWQRCVALSGLACLAGCGVGAQQQGDGLRATIGAEGGELAGAKGSPYEGVRMVIPAGALAQKTEIEIKAADVALPPSAVRIGPQIQIAPVGLALAQPAQLTLPFDERIVAANPALADQIKGWVRSADQWTAVDQTGRGSGAINIQVGALSVAAAAVTSQDLVQFDLLPNPKFVDCLQSCDGPTAHVIVVRGPLNDTLFIHGEHIKAGLAFDLFTVENSSLGSDGKPDPEFKNFGLAWYQSDLEASSSGVIDATIETILLDQIFGFDPAVGLAPTNTFHVGFWFNDPKDAQACGFDPTKPTPFNGEHKAGPLAMITVPDALTGLGPLCTKPDTSTTPAHCNP